MTQTGGLGLEARALVPLAGLHTMQGDFDEGRRLYERSKSIRRELGLTLPIAIGTESARYIHLLAGDVEEAERELRWGYETLEQMGEQAVRSTLAASLAEALYRQRRYEEAEHFVRAGLEAASPDDIASQVSGRMVMAKLLAVKGLGDRAELTARKAVALAEKTDDLFTRGQANLALADVLLSPTGAREPSSRSRLPSKRATGRATSSRWSGPEPCSLGGRDGAAEVVSRHISRGRSRTRTSYAAASAPSLSRK